MAATLFGAPGGCALAAIPACIQDGDDPAYGRVPGRQRGAPPASGYPGVLRSTSRRATQHTHWRGYPEGIRLKASWYQRWESLATIRSVSLRQSFTTVFISSSVRLSQW